MDTWRHHAEFEVGTKVLLSTHNIHLHGTKKFRNKFVGPFVITQHIGGTAYRLDLSSHAALHGIHNVFQVFMLHERQDNGVHTDVLPIEINGEAEHEVSGIK